MSVESPSDLVEVSGGLVPRQDRSARRIHALELGRCIIQSTTMTFRSTSEPMCTSATATRASASTKICSPRTLIKRSRQFAQVKDMLKAFERFFGEYPFPQDGYKLVHPPLRRREPDSYHLWQPFRERIPGQAEDGDRHTFDFIIVHESAHEWFGRQHDGARPLGTCGFTRAGRGE